MWSWAELIRYCLRESAFVLFLKYQNVYPGPPFQSLELFLAFTPLGEPLLMHGVFLDGGLVGEIPWCSSMQGILHSPGMTENFYMSRIVTKIICCANQQGQGFLQKRVKENLKQLAWKSACASSLGCATLVHWSSTNTLVCSRGFPSCAWLSAGGFELMKSPDLILY